nr:AAA-like domain-containing protein [[Phormidium] sp. ETS-05]
MAPSQYKVGSSLDYQHPTYVQRRADVELHESLCRSEFCYVLNSRQMGKSSLRVQAMARLTQVGRKCAVIDLTEIGTYDVTPEKWYLGIIRRLVKTLDLGVKFEYRQWWRERDALSAVDRFSQFLEEVLLVNIADNIVIFIDEIDSILSLNFGDDFFACIRSCYDNRSAKTAYNRLTFCLLGVATPSDLIKDKIRTPFNIGRSIELTGFTFDEAKNGLLAGLTAYVPAPEMVLGEILQWTGGQPFLSQKLCQLVCNMADGDKPVVVEDLVRKQIVENWETQDEPEHLKTIKNRILSREKRAGRLLGLYQEILQCGFVPADDGEDQTELRLAGLAVKQGGRLQVYNRIYECVFDQAWVTQELQGLRPYAEAINAWLGSDCQDESRLLRGQALQDALAWKAGKSLSEEDERFLDASQALEKREFQRALETEKEESRILANANDTLRKAEADANANLTKAQYTARRIVGVALAGLGAIVAVAVWVIGEAKSELNEAKIAEIKSMNSAATALLNVGNELESLMASLIATSNLQDAAIPAEIREKTVANLQEQLSQVRERNQWQAHEGAIWEVRFSPDGKLLATAGEDNTVKIWSRKGELRASLTHSDRVYGLDFSPDGSLIATASQEKAVKLWNLEGKLLKTFPQQAESLLVSAFTPKAILLLQPAKMAVLLCGSWMVG